MCWSSSSRFRLRRDEVARLRPILLPKTPTLFKAQRSVPLFGARLLPLTQRTLRLLTTQADPRANGVNVTSEEGMERSVEERDIVTEASESYLAYAMSVIVGRALPDVRDGLKPVHRRILYGMHELRMTADKPFKKCARVVGEVLGKYHPHGDVAVYNALVRMAQDFSMRYTLINGHGNFGSLDNDPPAAMRYTECKLSGIAGEMLLDHLEENTVDFMDTFDASQQEPMVFPAKVPHLLINGSSGIAVGVATRIPPHNMTEIVRALKALIQNPDISVPELMKHVPAPDFPTGGEILRTPGLKQTYETGRGSVLIRGKVEMEGEESKSGRGKRHSKNAIVITELPYLTNKAHFVEHVAKLVENQTLEGIADILDESDRDGMRVVIELKRGTMTSVVLNNLYKHTELQSRFACNMIALVNGRPETLNLKQMLSHFLAFRMDVIRRRAQFQLDRASQRLSIVVGLLKALEHVEDVVTLLRQSEGVAQARQSLCDRLDLNEEQAVAIAAMPLSRLTVREITKLEEEKTALTQQTTKLRSLLDSDAKVLKEIQNEANQVDRRFGDSRRSELVEDMGELSDMDIIPNNPMIIAFSQKGYIKRMVPDAFSVQKRGGKGVHGAKMRSDDTMNEVLHVLAHDQLLFFANDGRVFAIRAFQIPQSSRTAVGSPLSMVLPGLKGARITSIFTLGDKMDTEGKDLLLGTKKGLIKRTPLEHFKFIRSSGLIACRLVEGDELRFVQTASEESSVLMASNNGRVSRFNVDRLPSQGRMARGVKGLNVKEGEVVGMAVLPHGVESDSPDEVEEPEDIEIPEEEEISSQAPAATPALSGTWCLMVTEKGIGKLVHSGDFPTKNRGRLGNLGIRLKESDKLVALRLVSLDSGPQELILASKQGMMTRIRVDSVRQLGRYSRGVKVMNMNLGDCVTSATTVLEAVTNY